MGNANHQKTIIVLLCVLVVMMAFVVGFILMNGGKAPPSEPVAQGAPSGAIAPAQAPVSLAPDPVLPVAPVLPARVERVAGLDPPLNPTRGHATTPYEPAKGLVGWTARQNGCNVVQKGTEVHIFGVNDDDGWDKENGVTSVAEFPVGDFEASVDMKMPKFDGPGKPRVYLKIQASNTDYVGIQYVPEYKYYLVQRWTAASNQMGRTVRDFGDEATTYHRMNLKYDAATHVTTATVDDKLIGTVTYELTGAVHMVLAAGQDYKGHDIDIYYDRPTLSIGGKTYELGTAEKP